MHIILEMKKEILTQHCWPQYLQDKKNPSHKHKNKCINLQWLTAHISFKMGFFSPHGKVNNNSSRRVLSKQNFIPTEKQNKKQRKILIQKYLTMSELSSQTFIRKMFPPPPSAKILSAYRINCCPTLRFLAFNGNDKSSSFNLRIHSELVKV